MDAPLPRGERKPETGRLAELRTFLRFGLTCAGLLMAALGTAWGLVFLVPDGNDYAQATLLKHNRLAHYDGRKIVLVGGSNLAFGIDSTMIERATGCPVVNMGMNGFLGVRYMLREVKAQLNPSDIVVLAFEWDNFYKSVDGTSSDLIAIGKANPAAFTYLSLGQIKGAVITIPDIAQRKALRLFAEAIEGVTGIDTDPMPPKLRLLEKVPTLSGFTPEGDLVSHLDVSWPYGPADGSIPDDGDIETQAINLMRDFTAEMAKRDVSVVVSYSPITLDYYDRHRATLDEAHRLISTTPPLQAPSPPAAFAFDQRYFFDTVYHLNAEGRPLRTQRLIDDLESLLNERVHCPKTTGPQIGERFYKLTAGIEQIMRMVQQILPDRGRAGPAVDATERPYGRVSGIDPLAPAMVART